MKTTKIALVQPEIQTGKSLGIRKAPESIMILAAVLEAAGHVVRMFHDQWEKVVEGVKEFSPDLVGVSTMTPNFPEGKFLAQALKAWRQELPIVLGGWHASGAVQAHLSGQESESLVEILNHNSPFDFIVAGEGEEIFPELVRKLTSGEKVNAGNGVSFFSDGRIQCGGMAPRVKNLGALPQPSWAGLEIDRYRDQRSGALDLSVHFNRSCRFRCSFCSTPTVYGSGVRTTPAAQAVHYIRHLCEEFHPSVITFTDEDFFANMGWVEELVRILGVERISQTYEVSFDTFASIPDLYRLERAGRGEFLNRMAAVGFGSFTIGVESFNPDILVKYNKTGMILATMNGEEREEYDKADEETRKRILVTHYRLRVQQAVLFAQAHGILVVGDYMIGNLGEDFTEVSQGFEMFKDLEDLLIAYIPVFTPFPGTGVWAEAYRSSLLPRTAEGGIDWSKFNASSGAMDLGWKVGDLRDELELEFYTGDRYQLDMVRTLRTRPELKGLFQGRFNYLVKLFPEDSRPREMLKLLGK